MEPQRRRRAPSREGMKVTTIALPIAMHQRLARLALANGTVITQLVREAIAEYLAHPAAPKGRAQR